MPESCKIFVGGLPAELTKEAMQRYFEHFGVVKETLIMTDHVTGHSRGAFLRFFG